MSALFESSLLKERPGSPDTLAPDERRRISIRLGTGCAALVLLGLGALLISLNPDQVQIGESCQALAAIVVGLPTLYSGLRGLLNGDTRRVADQLVAIAVLAAASRGQFVTATVIPLLLELSRIFEERGSLGARAAIEGIRALNARQAVRLHQGEEQLVNPDDLARGDEILVRPGQRIAVDGTVLEGTAAVDQSAITGESVYENVGPGSPVFAGTVALDGLLRIVVRGSGSDTVLGRVVQLLAEVEQAHVPVLRLVERRAGVWLPFVLTIAASTLFFTGSLSRAVAVLVVATPTAFVVTGPAAIVAAMTAAARLRILITSADFLERASEVDTLILDKTGTVTVGAPSVTEIRPADGVSEADLLTVAADCGFGSLHPVSRAIVAEALTRGISAVPPKDLQERPGLGVIATLRSGGVASLGSPALLRELHIAVPEAQDVDASVVWAALDGRWLGSFVYRDRPRPEAREALDAMRQLGIERLILLTGDKSAAAHEVGQALGIETVIAEVLPAQKLEVVRAEQAAGRVVMMVGDGVNDAPALKAADVGVAIGAELNEVALGGSDVALLGPDLGRLPQLIELADLTRTKIGQNVRIAFCLSLVLIVFAATGLLQPWAGALAQFVTVLIVIANSARILRSGQKPSA